MFVAGFLGLFFAGAVYMPIVGDYLGRVIFTLGLMSIVYGGESLLRLGQVRACTIDFSVGSCTNHNLVTPAVIIAVCFYVLWLWWAYGKELGGFGNAHTNTVRRQHNTIQLKAKPNYATAALVCALVCGGWIFLDPAKLPADSYGSLSFQARLGLVLAFGALLYNLAGKQVPGDKYKPLVTVVFSAVAGFFGTGLVYHFKAWAPPLDSPVDALFSLVVVAGSGGFKSVLNLSTAANAFVPALLLWAGAFAWMQSRLQKRIEQTTMSSPN